MVHRTMGLPHKSEPKNSYCVIWVKQCAEQLKYDDEIIRLKTAIRKASEAKMTNGVLSVTELMRDLHAEQMAIQDKIRHEIAYMQALYDLKFTAGHTNE